MLLNIDIVSNIAKKTEVCVIATAYTLYWSKVMQKQTGYTPLSKNCKQIE